MKMRLMLPLFLLSASQLLAIPKSYVSAGGSDANTCDRTHPCATLSAALAVTDADGTVDALDIGEFGPLTAPIGSSVTIDLHGMGTVTGGFNCGGSTVIFCVTSTGVSLTLRNMTIQTGTGIEWGVYVSTSGNNLGSALVIDNSTIFGGSDQVLASQRGVGVLANSTNLAVELTSVRFLNLFVGLTASGGKAYVSQCLFQKNYEGISAGPVALMVENSKFHNNGTGLYLGNSVTTVQVENSSIHGNTTGIGFFTTGPSVRLGNNSITDNGTGFVNTAGVTITSFGNNLLTGNTNNGNPNTTVVVR